MYYFSSDTHFDNENTLKNDNRHFKNAKQFADKTIKLWNNQTRKSDANFVDCNLNRFRLLS